MANHDARKGLQKSGGTSRIKNLCFILKKGFDLIILKYNIMGGVFTSRLGAYTNATMMSTDTTLHFQNKLQSQWETAKAVGQMQTIQQMNLGQQGAGAGSAGTAWGGGGWYTLSEALVGITKFAGPVALAGVVLVIVFNGTEMMMFFATFLATFFFMLFSLHQSKMFRVGIQNGMNILASLFIALVVGAFIGFGGVYKHKEDKPNPPPYYYNEQRPANRYNEYDTYFNK